MNDRAWQLEVDGIALHAGGRARARRLIDAASFVVRSGERWVVLGPNGAGKSSLLAALAGVFRLSAGSVRLQGRAIIDWPLDELADWRAWCPQFWLDPFAATVGETVRMARERRAFRFAFRRTRADDRSEPDVQRVLDRLDLAALRDADVRTLSGGERQRVAIATAMLQDARLLLLDEPASHLDLAHQQALVGLLHEHADAGHAVVASLHDLNLAWSLATHAVLLDGRGGACCGPRDDVLVPAALRAAFGVAIDTVEVCGERRFWIGPS